MEQEYSHLNLAGLSLWYQMTNKPDYFQTFEALTHIRQQFVDEFFFKTVAYQAYHYIFKNQNTVVNSVLRFMDPANATVIYTDEYFGMDAPSKLYYWVAAMQGKKGSQMYNLLQTYFTESKSINLTDANMTQIFAPQNMLSQMLAATKSLSYKLFQNDSSNVFSNDVLWQREWANKTVFADPRYYLSP